MAEDGEEPVPSSAYEFNAGDVVILLVGPQERKMVVHSPQITAHSEFFTAALKKEWIEGQAREIKLPEEEPEIMAHYIEYVYFGKLRTDIYTTTSPGKDKKLGFQLLAQLYILAERMLNSECRNRILQEFLRLTNLKNAKGKNWSPHNVSIDIIYQGTTSNSPARRLLVDIHASIAHEHWYPEDVHVSPVFLTDLLRKFLHNVDHFTKVKSFRHLDLKAEDYRV